MKLDGLTVKKSSNEKSLRLKQVKQVGFQLNKPYKLDSSDKDAVSVNVELQSPDCSINETFNEFYTYESEDDSITNVKSKFYARFFCRIHGRSKINWDIFIMVLAVINCFQIPYQVAFTENDNSNVAIDILNYFIDVFFVLDVFINFRTSFINEYTGLEITNPKLSAYNYVKTRFVIDLIASIPFDYFSYFIPNANDNSLVLKLFSLLKLVRILRLGRLVAHLDIKNELKTSIKLVKLIFFVCMFIHLLACVWFWIVKQDDKWIPPLDYLYLQTDLYEGSGFYQY